jgi:hypothetical protein
LLLTRKLLNQGFLLVKLKSSLRKFTSPPWLGWSLWIICVTSDHGYVPLVVSTSRSFPNSRLITGFVTRLTRRVPLVEQKLLTLPEHLSSPSVFSGVRVTRSLVLYVCFVDRCFSFCTFSFGHCVVCSSSIYGFWLPLWYLQTLLTKRWGKPKSNPEWIERTIQRYMQPWTQDSNRRHRKRNKKEKYCKIDSTTKREWTEVLKRVRSFSFW